MIGLFRTYLRPYVAPLVGRPRAAARRRHRQPVPAGPQRRHHQQGRRQGRHRLHPPNRRADARRHRRRSASPRSRRSTSRARIAMGFGRDVRRAVFATVETFSQVEVNQFGPASLITRNTNDVQQVQTVVFIGLTTSSSRRRSSSSAGSSWPSGPTSPLSGLLVVVLPLMALVIGLVMSRAIPLFRATQDEARPDQPGHARDAVRACASSGRSSGRGTRRPASTTANRDLFDTTLRVGRLFAADAPGDDRDPQPVDRGGHVVRRDAGRRRRDARSAT